MPDATEPITAFRAWVALAPGMLLRSLNGETRWIPGEWMTARCPLRSHRAPHEGCSCGFYAAKGRDEVLTMAAGSMLVFARLKKEADECGAVVGMVHLAGKVIEHAHGYRAERARVAEILPVSGWNQSAGMVAELYAVPLGEEIPAPPLPDFDSLPSVVISCQPSTEPAELTVIGRLSFLAFSLLLVVGAVLGIAENHRLDWSDWFLCLIVIGGMLVIGRSLATLPRAMRGVSFTMRGPPASQPRDPTIVPDRPRPY